MKFHVVRTFSHTDKRQLWKIESRPMTRMEDAKSWRDFCESMWKKEHPRARRAPHFFVAAVELPESMNENQSI